VKTAFALLLAALSPLVGPCTDPQPPVPVSIEGLDFLSLLPQVASLLGA
jgi:hypothetical protein